MSSQQMTAAGSLAYVAPVLAAISLLHLLLSKVKAAQPTPGRPLSFFQFLVLTLFVGPATHQLSIISVASHAVSTLDDMSSKRFWVSGVLIALVPSLLMNVFIVGLNQLTDVEIDRINKPTLPVASGEFSPAFGHVIVWSSLVGALAYGWRYGTTSLWITLVAAMILGTVYSLPPFRLKRFPVLAAACILLVRGVLVQVGFYWHTRSVFAMAVEADRAWTLSGFLLLPPGLIYATIFVILFSVVIALFKDIPDVEGDAKHGIQSFSVKFGISGVFWLCVSILEFDFALGLLAGGALSASWSQALTIGSHTLAVALIYLKANQVDLKSKASITSFYMFVWKLFYLEYMLFPFMR